MNDLKNIIWLASYPKSGNTWFRAFLTAYLNPSLDTIDINNLYDTTIASSRILFDEMSGIASSDLTFDEIDLLRPEIYRRNAAEADDIIYQKTHDAWQVLPDGKPLFPREVTKGVVYFIRNPLDVAVSFANHLNTTIDRTIGIMNNPDYAFCSKSDRLHNQLRQKLKTWSSHVTSWLDESGLPVHMMRYEDMKTEPLKTFTNALEFLGLDSDMARIQKALLGSSFEELRRQEELKGFKEKSSSSPGFFRKGIVNDWKNVLTREQGNRLTEAHSVVMKRFGYEDNLKI